MQENNQNTADTRGIDAESIEDVDELVGFIGEWVSEALCEAPVVGVDIELDVFTDEGLEFVRDVIVTTMREESIFPFAIYGAVTNDGKMIFTALPDSVCEILSDKTDKEYDDLRNQLVGPEDTSI